MYESECSTTLNENDITLTDSDTDSIQDIVLKSMNFETTKKNG